MTSRVHSPVDIYHVVARGTGRQLIFEEDADRRKFLAFLRDALRDFDVEMYAWCLMGNHFHLLLHAPLDRISSFMHQVCGRYAQWFNAKAGRSGHLFQARYKSEAICDETYFLAVIRYIHANPQKAGISPLEFYRWSSYAEYTDAGGSGLCKTAVPLEVLGGTEQFLLFHRCMEDKTECLDVDPLRSKTRAMADERAIELASEVAAGVSLDEIKALPREDRRRLLREFKNAGLSIRQIERLTGIGRNAIARA